MGATVDPPSILGILGSLARRAGKAKRAHQVKDGGHAASAPLPTLRLLIRLTG
jgi:hypothetical protein